MKENGLNAHQESILQVLKRGGWKTSSELAHRTGIRLGSILKEMENLIDEEHILLVFAPGRAHIPLYHSMFAEARYLADSPWWIDYQDLPWRLKRSMISKIDRLYPHKWPAQVPVWARALLVFENHLAGMHLCTIQSHPSDRVLFPSWWRATYMPGPSQWCAQRKKYEFQVCFAEVVPPQIARCTFPNFLSDGPCTRKNDKLQCVVRERETGMFIELQNVANARAKEKKPFKLTQCPPREEIVDETTRQLQDGASEWHIMNPFTPVKLNRKFNLLTNRTDLAGANHAKSGLIKRGGGA